MSQPRSTADPWPADPWPADPWPADPWPAPRAADPIRSTISLPGSKSLTSRALVLAALSDGPSVISGALRSRDTELMAQALLSLGARIDTTGDDWSVVPGRFHGPATIDCGLAGTVMRFVPPVAALADGPVILDGDPHARSRPLSDLLAALRTLGVSIDDDGRGGLPLTVLAEGHVRGGVVTLDASASSQFISALLLVGARYDEGVDVRHDGKAIPSLPHIEMTVEQLRLRGVPVDDCEPNRWRISPGPIHAVDMVIEPDLSNAAPFLAAALVSGGEVTVRAWPQHTTQAGDFLRHILASMGAEVTLDDDGLTVRGTRQVHGIDVDLHEAGELTPVVAALAVLADSPSQLRGIAHIRGHETDRLEALATEFNRLGGRVVETDDGLRITPVALHGGVFHTYADHRIAHAGVVLGLAVDDIVVENIGTTAKTFPDFADVWSRFV